MNLRIGLCLTVAAPLVLAACSRAPEQAGAAEGANAVDPAIASALQDQIMVDPALQQQANADAVRPPTRPASGGVPPDDVAAVSNPIAEDGALLRAPPPAPADRGCEQCTAAREAVTLGGLAERQKDGRTRACASQLHYSAAWANRLPPELPLYPHARVTEAAGADAGGCALRVVSFSAPVSMQGMLDWYYTRATRAGYASGHQADGDQHILGGTRKRDAGAYVLFLTPRADGGTDIDLVANNGT